MIKEKKEHSRSIRMTNTVKEFIDSQDGNGFNEKFENLVLYCKANLPKLESQIKEKEKQLKELATKFEKQQNILNEIDNIKWSLDSMKRNIEQVIDKTIAISEKNM